MDKSGKVSSAIPMSGKEPKGPKQSSGKTKHARMYATKVESQSNLPGIQGPN
jgi:hypothetical protein